MSKRLTILLPAVASLMLCVSAGASSLHTYAIMADNPVAYYRMNETSGTTMVDAIAANNGTYGGGVTLNAAGPQSPAFPAFDATNKGGQFNGTAASEAVIPTVAGLSTTTYSMEVWFNYSGLKLQYLIGRGSSASLSYDSVGLNNNQLLYFNGSDPVTISVAVSQNAWHDLVFTRNGAAVNVYLDGVNQINIASAANTFGASTRIVVGDRPGDLGALNPAGFFDEVALYNTALTAAQVQQHFAPVPEPASVVLLGVGVVAMLKRKR